MRAGWNEILIDGPQSYWKGSIDDDLFGRYQRPNVFGAFDAGDLLLPLFDGLGRFPPQYPFKKGSSGSG